MPNSQADIDARGVACLGLWRCVQAAFRNRRGDAESQERLLSYAAAEFGGDRRTELRAGVASTLPGAQQEQRLTLEEIFLSIVGQSGGEQSRLEELTWLT